MKINYTFKMTETERETLKVFDKRLETVRKQLELLNKQNEKNKKERELLKCMLQNNLEWQKKDKNEIINGLNSLILYNDCYEDVFGHSLSEEYDMTLPDEILEHFKNSLESSYIDIVKD